VSQAPLPGRECTHIADVAYNTSTFSGVSSTVKNLLEFTRLALQLFLVKGFKLYSFQLQDPKEPCISIYCHYLPVSGLGNLRACCLPWMWEPFLRLPLRNRTLIPRYPLKPW